MIHYVRQTQKTTLEHITGLSYSEAADYLMLDAATIRNLELFESASGDTKDTPSAALRHGPGRAGSSQ